MSEQLLITICTKAETLEQFQTRPIFFSLKKHTESNPNIDFKLFTNNKQGLSKCYNEVLKDSSNLNKIVLFVHDDVELNDIWLYEKLINSPYSITGLAGAKSFNKLADNLAWHLAAHKESFVGEVAHTKDGNTWTTVFGPTNSRALTLDGLFLSVKVKDLVDNEVYFDEDFNFHFYDLAFCLKANEKRVTCGVSQIHVIHHGLGDSMLSAEWQIANKQFKEKYCK
jgi:hypothetical protein